jgi:hypothetical protein
MALWMPVAEFPRYEVSDAGEVRVASTKRLVNSVDNGEGYLQVPLPARGNRNIKRYVHRLVAIAFLPNPNGYPQVRHHDGDNGNNCASNLRWGTQAQNEADKKRHGTVTRGDIHPMRRMAMAGQPIRHPLNVREAIQRCEPHRVKELRLQLGVSEDTARRWRKAVA